MKILNLISLAALSCSLAFSHTLWVKGENKDTFEANIIYGHNFPNPEEIEEKEKEPLSGPIVLRGENLYKQLTQSGNFYHYKLDEKLKEGTYILEVPYKPTIWSIHLDDTWQRDKTRKDIKKEIKSCGIYTYTARQILTIGKNDGNFAKTMTGKGLEIVPLVKFSEFKRDSVIKFRVVRDAKPVKRVQIFGTYSGYSKNDMSMAFYAKTDLNGEFEFRPLASGLWYLKAHLDEKIDDKDCEKRFYGASLTFEVK
ncbi:DUF4198 domain-containing protein [Campylobacter sp.]|uniref:DUF4198 domain-containing protein n=1 Tax=Campylobacter sp. TaxID=205 RepID=UPI002704FF65|nr:DUF4198 domain-containing protein [Campylobacter sp.]